MKKVITIDRLCAAVKVTAAGLPQPAYTVSVELKSGNMVETGAFRLFRRTGKNCVLVYERDVSRPCSGRVFT